MDDIYKKIIIEKISKESGIIIAPIHVSSILSFVDKQLVSLNLSIEDYCKKLDVDNNILNNLINQATTNETYFFREEKQFDYLKEVVFPKFRNKKLVVWSAACSSGEEPLSLLALALHFNIDIEIYASDIDDNVLAFFKKGCYSKYSFRNDGSKYHEYLRGLGEADKSNTHFIFKHEVLKRINIFKYNLTEVANLPVYKKVDIIFMRNVFIYFDIKTRKAITEKIASLLNENGHLFYSINEIGNINSNIVPPVLKKENYKQIYFYTKKSSDNNFCTANNTANNAIEKNISYYNNRKENIKSIEKETRSEKIANKSECFLLKPCDVFYNIKLAIDRKDFDGALKIINEYKPAFADSYYSSFFKGYTFMKKEDYSSAEKYFITSEFMKNSFWPVYFFHGVLLERGSSKEKSVYCFKKCLEQMRSYIENPSSEYNFLFKEFSPSFIYSYCSKNIKE